MSQHEEVKAIIEDQMKKVSVILTLLIWDTVFCIVILKQIELDYMKWCINIQHTVECYMLCIIIFCFFFLFFVFSVLYLCILIHCFIILNFNCNILYSAVFFFIYFYQLKANYFTTFQCVLSYIDMNQPWSYMYSPFQSPLPPPSPPDSSGSSQCTRPEHLFLFSKAVVIRFSM